MDTKLGFSIAVIISFFARSIVSVSSNTIDLWCKKTPYPQQCQYFMIQNRYHLPKRNSEFRRMVIEVAMRRAFTAQTLNKNLFSKCRSKKEIAALTDCLSLYDDTIAQLNRTLDPNTKCTNFDIQTWLSAALTNLETCREGFIELGVSDFVLPLMSNNVSKLISNALAINNASNFSPQARREGFPRWVKGRDRKLLQAGTVSADVVVAQDGSGDYTTIREVFNAAAARSESDRRLVIHIKRGVYEENLVIEWKNVMLVGDGLRHTIITGNRSVGGGFTTLNSATVAVAGDGFIARSITFRNTAGPKNRQAVALQSGSDHSVFYQCGFEGYQDTLYVYSQRQFYKECYIYGTIDFIFGNAAVVLQNCIIYARRPMRKQKNVITAQGRSDPNQNTGISIHHSRVMAASDLRPKLRLFKTYLGRPWRQYSRTVFVRSYLDSLVDPAGWRKMDGDFAIDTLYFGEYKNIGPASSTRRRVNWRGYRVITDATEASQFMVGSFIEGQSWLPDTGVPFASGL